MKSICLSILGLSLFFSLQSSAQNSFSNPLIRTCVITGGVFYVTQVEEDQIGFCKYGNSLIDAMSVMDSATARFESAAKLAALGAGTDCASAAGELLVAKDVDNVEATLCLFEDGSMIEKNTLARGSAHAENAGLVQALNVRF
jgi:putative hemolysin